MARYIVQGHRCIRKEHVSYFAGDTIELPDADAAVLQKEGLIGDPLPETEEGTGKDTGSPETDGMDAGQMIEKLASLGVEVKPKTPIMMLRKMLAKALAEHKEE